MTEVSCQLIRFLKTKTFLGNSKNGERNHVNEQRTHKYRERGRREFVSKCANEYVFAKIYSLL